jgi:hypothetical protein
MAIDGGFATNVLCASSSHFCSAEKQFRFPLELGNQRAPSSQWTVTGARLLHSFQKWQWTIYKNFNPTEKL